LSFTTSCSGLIYCGQHLSLRARSIKSFTKSGFKYCSTQDGSNTGLLQQIDEHEVLYRLVRCQHRLIPVRYLPASLIPRVLHFYHNSDLNGAHFGIKRRFYKLRDRFFWPQMYRDIEHYNATRHTTTNYTPFELMFVRQPRLVADIASPPPVLELPQHQHHMRKFISHATFVARNNTIERRRITKTHDDTNSSNPRYLVDQNVFIKNHEPSRNKFSPRFIGPFTIARHRRDKTYIVRSNRSQYPYQVNTQHIRPIRDSHNE
jgi:hypothetical protein